MRRCKGLHHPAFGTRVESRHRQGTRYLTKYEFLPLRDAYVVRIRGKEVLRYWVRGVRVVYNQCGF